MDTTDLTNRIQDEQEAEELVEQIRNTEEDHDFDRLKPIEKMDQKEIDEMQEYTELHNSLCRETYAHLYSLGLNKEQLKNFIKARANDKMIELGYTAVYNDIDPNLLKQMEWFGHLTSGKTHQDFFAGRVTSYSKSNADWEDL